MLSKTNINIQSDTKRYFQEDEHLTAKKERQRRQDALKAPVSTLRREASTWDITKIPDDATRFEEEADFFEPDNHSFYSREADSWQEDVEDEIDYNIEKDEFFVLNKRLNVGNDRNRSHNVKAPVHAKPEAKTWVKEAAIVQGDATRFEEEADCFEPDKHSFYSREADSWQDVEDEIDYNIEKDEFFVPHKSLYVDKDRNRSHDVKAPEAKTWEKKAATVQDSATRFEDEADFFEPDKHSFYSREADSWQEDVEDEIDYNIEKDDFFVPYKSLNEGKDRNRCHDVKAPVHAKPEAKTWEKEAATVQDDATRFMEDAEFFEPDEHLVDRNKRNALPREACVCNVEIQGGIDSDTEDEKTCVPYETLIVRKYRNLRHYLDAPVQNTKRKASALEEQAAAVEDYISRFMQEDELSLQNERKHRKTIACEKQIALAERMCRLFTKILEKYKKILDKQILEQLEEIKIELAKLSEGKQCDFSLNYMLYEVTNIEKQIAAYLQSQELVDCRLILINSEVTALKMDLLEYKRAKIADLATLFGQEIFDFNYGDAGLDNWMSFSNGFYKQ